MFGQERSKIEPEWCRKNKNILRTSEAENGYFFKNAQPGLEKCGSYIKKKCNLCTFTFNGWRDEGIDGWMNGLRDPDRWID